ncbi:MAG: gamma-glutamylcyclotransferase family protein [Sphingobium sp.]
MKNKALQQANENPMFVYGTLRRGCLNDRARSLHASADWLGAARVRGRLYRVGWYPALLLDDRADYVIGDLFRLHDPSAMLAVLDDYEGVGCDFPEPWEYRREQIMVETSSDRIAAWAYIFNLPVDGLPMIAGGDFLAP